MDFDSDQESITPNQRPYIKVNTTGALWLPAGTNAQRPTHNAGLLRYNSDSPGIEYSDGSTWTTLGGGSGPAVAQGDLYPVHWFITYEWAKMIFDPVGSTLNLNGGLNFDNDDLGPPVAGQTVFLTWGNGTISYEGIYVLGSVASLSDVPITRHPDWPATREIKSGTRILALWAPPFDTVAQSETLDAAYVSSSTEKIGLPFYTQLPVGYIVAFKSLESGAVMPGGLALNTLYKVATFTYDDGFGGSHTMTLETMAGTAVNITSSGTNASGGAIATIMFGAPFEEELGAEITLLHGSTYATQDGIWTWATQDGPSAQSVTYKTYYSGSNWDFPLTVLGRGASGGEIAIGDNARSARPGYQSMAIGQNSSAMASSSTAIGYSAYADSMNALAVGSGTNALGMSAVAVGVAANAYGRDSVAIGAGANTVAEGSIVFGTRQIPMSQYTSTMLLRILSPSLDDTEISLGINTLKDGSMFTVRGTIQATSMSSTASAVWSVDGVISLSTTSRVSDLILRRVGGDGSAASAAYKLRYTLGATASTTFTTAHDLEFFAIGAPADTVLWTGDLWLQGTPSGAYSPTSIYGVPKAWDVGPSVRAEASTTLTAGQFVNVYSASGTAKVRPADAAAGYEATGFVLENYVNTNIATVYLSGENHFLTGLTVGPLYLSTTAGAVTGTVYTSAGTLVQPLGTALSSTKMLVQIGVPVML